MFSLTQNALLSLTLRAGGGDLESERHWSGQANGAPVWLHCHAGEQNESSPNVSGMPQRAIAIKSTL